MILDLKKIFVDSQERLTFQTSMDLSDVDLNGAKPFLTPVSANGTVFTRAGAAVLEAVCTYGFSIPCDRCLEPVGGCQEKHFSHVLVRSLENEDNDTYIEVRDEQLDVDELLRADILLDLPTKFLCKPDCQGLCSSCGQNLNNGPCNCNMHQIDPRLEVLKKLID